MNQKPDCPLLGADDNIFNLMGAASRTLVANGLEAVAKEMCERIGAAKDYDTALNIMSEYVNPVEAEQRQSGYTLDW